MPLTDSCVLALINSGVGTTPASEIFAQMLTRDDDSVLERQD